MTSQPKTLPACIINSLSAVGIISAFCFRIIILLDHLDPSLVRPIWYIGVTGSFAFFGYRYWISQKRRRAVEESGLIEKLQTEEELNSDDRNIALYLLSSIQKSRENWNYLAIFILSLVAVVGGLILTVLG